MQKEVNKKEEENYCWKCGAKMFLITEDNEKNFFTLPLWAMGMRVNEAGKRYSPVNGKRMYRTEWHCPIKEKSSWFGKPKSHLIFLGEKNLTD